MRLLGFLVLGLAVACGGGEEPWRETARVPDRTEVFVIPTLHRVHQRSEAFSMHFLAELIRQVRPDVILVEVPPVRFAQVEASANREQVDEWLVHFPEVLVALHVADELRAEVVPVSGWSAEVTQRHRVYFAEHPEGPDEPGYRRAADQLGRASQEQEADDPEWLFSPRYRRLSGWADHALSTYAAEQLGPADPVEACSRHLEHIHKAIEERPGKRFAILFDARRRWCIERSLRRQDHWVADPRALLDL